MNQQDKGCQQRRSEAVRCAQHGEPVSGWRTQPDAAGFTVYQLVWRRTVATTRTPCAFFASPSLNLESTTNNQDVSWGENGLPRAAGSRRSNAGTQQITVQVQAMDSQSFLDHSDDIAQAVRQAMLNMNSLNDVVTSL